MSMRSSNKGDKPDLGKKIPRDLCRVCRKNISPRSDYLICKGCMYRLVGIEDVGMYKRVKGTDELKMLREFISKKEGR